MKIQIQINSQNAPYVVTKISEGEKEYLVVPVIMMVEGVHEGSGGASLHLLAELEKYYQAFDGIPVTIDHPQDAQGVYISATEMPEICIGEIRNSNIEEGRLKADAYIDVQRLAAISPETLQMITDEVQIDVSIGIYSTHEEVQGEWNGEVYESITRNYQPDHLAILPHDRGACSWDDGCGIRNNQQKKKGEINMDVNEISKQASAYGYLTLYRQEKGYQEIMDILRAWVYAKDTKDSYHYLVDAYDNYFIFVARDGLTGKESFFKQSYAIEEGKAVVEGLAEEVIREVTYETLKQTEDVTRTKFNNNQKKEDEMNDKKPPCCLGKVEQLIANKQTRFGEADKDWLLSLDEATIDKLFPAESPEDVLQANREITMQVLKEVENNSEELLKLLPENLKKQVEEGFRLNKEHREELIQSILTNSTQDVWKKEELTEFTTDLLEKLSSSLVKPDFSAHGAGVVDKKEQEMLIPLT